MWLVFDYDGVIADSHQCIFKAFNDLAGEMKIPIEDRVDFNYWREKGSLMALKEMKISIFDLPSISRRMSEVQKRYIHEVKFYKDIDKTLKKIKESGINIGILTSNDLENVENNLKKNNLEIFDFIRTGAKYFGKAQRIKRIKRKIGNFWYVGDELRDVEACKKAGVPIIAVSWGFNDKKLLKDADYVVDTPKEFLNLVLRLSQ